MAEARAPASPGGREEPTSNKPSHLPLSGDSCSTSGTAPDPQREAPAGAQGDASSQPKDLPLYGGDVHGGVRPKTTAPRTPRDKTSVSPTRDSGFASDQVSEASGRTSDASQRPHFRTMTTIQWKCNKHKQRMLVVPLAEGNKQCDIEDLFNEMVRQSEYTYVHSPCGDNCRDIRRKDSSEGLYRSERGLTASCKQKVFGSSHVKIQHYSHFSCLKCLAHDVLDADDEFSKTAVKRFRSGSSIRERRCNIIRDNKMREEISRKGSDEPERARVTDGRSIRERLRDSLVTDELYHLDLNDVAEKMKSRENTDVADQYMANICKIIPYHKGCLMEKCIPFEDSGRRDVNFHLNNYRLDGRKYSFEIVKVMKQYKNLVFIHVEFELKCRRVHPYGNEEDLPHLSLLSNAPSWRRDTPTKTIQSFPTGNRQHRLFVSVESIEERPHVRVAFSPYRDSPYEYGPVSRESNLRSYIPWNVIRACGKETYDIPEMLDAANICVLQTKPDAIRIVMSKKKPAS